MQTSSPGQVMEGLTPISVLVAQDIYVKGIAVSGGVDDHLTVLHEMFIEEDCDPGEQGQTLTLIR